MTQDPRLIDCAATETTESQQVHLRLWQMMERRRWRIALGAVAGLALAATFCALFGPWYQSTAQLLIIKKHLETSPILGPNPDHPPGDELATHMLILSSPRVVGEAITRSHLLSLESFQKREGGLAQAVKDALSRVLPKARDVRPEDRLTQDIIDALTVNRDTMKPGITPSNEVLKRRPKHPSPIMRRTRPTGKPSSAARSSTGASSTACGRSTAIGTPGRRERLKTWYRRQDLVGAEQARGKYSLIRELPNSWTTKGRRFPAFD